MFNKNKLFLTILMACFALGTCKDAVELITKNSNPAAFATLTQLKVKESNSSKAIITYKCSVGFHPTYNIACSADDITSWADPHDVELKLRCPKSNSGSIISYVEIIYHVTSANVHCFVSEGAVGMDYIGMTVNAWSTTMFKYSAKFYS